MHEECLELSFGIVTKNHAEADILVKCKLACPAIDLLLKHEKDHGDQNGSKVLNEEDEFPADLESQVFEYKDYLFAHFFLREEATNCRTFV